MLHPTHLASFHESLSPLKLAKRLKQPTVLSDVQTSIQNHQKSKKARNIITKEHDNFLVTDTKDTETCKLPENDFKIIILRKLRESQKNMDI